MDPLFLDVLGAGTAGFVQGLSGFAFGLVAMSFWAWSITPQLAGPMAAFGSVLGQVVSIRSIHRGFDLRVLLPFIVGGVLGVPIGAVLLPHIDQTVFKAAVGAMLVLWCPVMLLSRSLPRITGGGSWADAAAGLVGGIMGGLAGLTGPAPTLWCTLRGWDKDIQRGVFQSFNLSMNALTLAVYTAGGIITAETVHMFVMVALAMVVPTLAGTWLYTKLGGAAFRQVVLTVLLISGVVLLISSISHLSPGPG